MIKKNAKFSDYQALLNYAIESTFKAMDAGENFAAVATAALDDIAHEAGECIALMIETYDFIPREITEKSGANTLHGMLTAILLQRIKEDINAALNQFREDTAEIFTN